MRHDALMVRTLHDTTIRYWNKGDQQLYGWVAQEALGERSRRLLDIIFPKPLQRIEKDLVEKGIIGKVNSSISVAMVPK